MVATQVKPILDRSDKLGTMNPEDLPTLLLDNGITIKVLSTLANEIQIMKRVLMLNLQYELHQSSFQAYCSINDQERKRVFYLVDMVHPTKKEIVLYSEDKIDPTMYAPKMLHDSLVPMFKDGALNTGQYEIISSNNDRIIVYFYVFGDTTAASSATADILELPRVSDDAVGEIKELLPKCDDIQFEEYEVPWEFYGKPDVLIITHKVRQELFEYMKKAEMLKPCYKFYSPSALQPLQHDPPSASQPLQPDPPSASQPRQLDPPSASQPRQLDPPSASQPRQLDPPSASQPLQLDPPSASQPLQLDPPSASQPLQLDPLSAVQPLQPNPFSTWRPNPLIFQHSLKGNENFRNQRLAIWLEEQLGNHFKKEEFTFIANEKNSMKISRFSNSRDDFCFFMKRQKQELDGASVVNVVDQEEVELCDADGDSKEDAKEADKHQVLANMNKCAADIAYSAAKRGAIFSKITVYGILVDYKPGKITKVYRMELDFNKRTSQIKRCEDVDLGISDGFSRIASVLKGAVVKR